VLFWRPVNVLAFCATLIDLQPMDLDAHVASLVRAFVRAHVGAEANVLAEESCDAVDSLVVLLGLTARLALKFGTKRIVSIGLTNMSIGLIIIGFCGADTAYWGPIIISMLFLANGLALVTSPSTDAVMGELPREKAGVGSAVNDVSREVGGTLGVAISGSVFASLYGPKLGELVAQFNLPAEAVALAKESAGAGFAVAERAPTPEAAEAVRQAVSEAFMHGFHSACFTGAGVALVGALLALKFLPARKAVISS
jgi:MFS family permease